MHKSLIVDSLAYFLSSAVVNIRTLPENKLVTLNCPHIQSVLSPLLRTNLNEAMLQGYSPLAQTAMGTALTWGVTALGASLCVFQAPNRRAAQKSMVLEWSLGFSAGVMLAASFWSLLQPAITLAEAGLEQGGLAMGRLSFLPAAIGFAVGALFILIADILFPEQNMLVPPKSPTHVGGDSWSCHLVLGEFIVAPTSPFLRP
ncbi:unnamed protein product [Schistocephalus solidus]|uniref:Zinc transporter ZIP11 n=1 Tax=Schistocephalus solidus TaxID=70667 RepID=A0A183SFS1_SCHSO|nr:unnamed protein product [Schistocephalus solidus]